MRAELPSDRDALIAIDGKIFLHPSDQLKYHQEWREVFWILEGNEVAGLTVLAPNFGIDALTGITLATPGCLLIMRTGILPERQGKGIGTYVKRWQIYYAKKEGFERIVTVCRRSNRRAICMNEKFGFVKVCDIPRYYADGETAIVMQLQLNAAFVPLSRGKAALFIKNQTVVSKKDASRSSA